MHLLAPTADLFFTPFTRPFGFKPKRVEYGDERWLFAWLDQDVQDKVIGELSSQATEDNWWAQVYDDAHELLVMLGFADIDISFSGFWSQGDGASFTGVWCPDFVNLEKARSEYQGSEEIDALINEISVMLVEVKLKGDGLPQITLSRSRGAGNYVHEQSIAYEHDYSHVSVSDKDAEEGKDLEIYEGRLEAWCVDLMCWIYRMLEAEYNDLSSRESIVENIDANDYRFSREGDIV